MKPGLHRRPAAAALAASLLLALAACDTGSEQRILLSAKAQMAANDVPAAIATLKSALDKHAQSPELRALLGQALLAGGHPAAAATELAKALELGHPERDGAPSLALALVAAGRAKEATDRFATTVLSFPEAEARLKTQMAWGYGAQGQPERMLEMVKMALAADANHAPALMLLARATAARGDTDEAMRLIEQSISADGEMAEAWHLKGDLLRQGRKADDAINAYRKAIELDAAFGPSYLDLMAVLQSRDDLAGMKAVAAAARQAMPGQPTVVMADAMLASAEGDLRRARELLHGVLKATRDQPRALQMAGVVELASGSWTQAEAYFVRVVQLSPDAVNARRLLALTRLRTARPVQAMSALQPLLDARSPRGDVLALAAEAQLQAGATARAETLLAQALKTDANDVHVRTAAAVARIARGDAAGGFADLDALAAQDGTPQGALTAVQAHLQRGDVDGALKAVERLEARWPDQPFVHDMRGRALLLRKDGAAARASFEKAVALRADYLPAADRLVALDLAENRIEPARQRLEAMLHIDPRYLPASLALVELQARQGATRAEIASRLAELVRQHPGEAQPRLQLAELHLADNDVPAALAVAQEAAATVADDPRLLEVLGRAQIRAGQTQQAIASLRKVTALDPRMPSPYQQLAALYQATDNASAAMQNYRRALEFDPTLEFAQKGLVALAIRSRSYEEALAMSRTVQAQQPKDGLGHVLEGDVRAAQRQWTAAVAAYRQAMHKSASTEAAIRLHGAHVELGQKAEAEALARSWLASHPRDVRFLMHLGDVALVTEELASAEKHYTEVLALQPKNDAALNNLAWLLMRQNKPGALEHAQKALEVRPDKPQYLDTLASVLAAERQFDKALDVQKKAVALAPDYNNGRLNLARIAIQAGDTRLAKDELERLSWLGDKFPAQKQVVQLMKSVQ